MGRMSVGLMIVAGNKALESALVVISLIRLIKGKLHMIWEPVLRPKTYKHIMCVVLESVFRRIAKDILLLNDMAADETLQVHECSETEPGGEVWGSFGQPSPMFTATRQRLDLFTSEEQELLLDVDPVMRILRRIMRPTSMPF